jgi:nucleoside 2-deoxyribosyltransferase
LADDVVPQDLQALDKADAVFAVVDGLDSGTLFEIGYARAKSIPVVAFVQNETPEDLKMLQGSDCIICSDFSTAVYTLNWLP